jgi:hypothetical protein
MNNREEVETLRSTTKRLEIPSDDYSYNSGKKGYSGNSFYEEKNSKNTDKIGQQGKKEREEQEERKLSEQER